MPITLNPNEKLTCVCFCPECGGGRTLYKDRQWQATTAKNHCQNQGAGCGFSPTQTASYQPY